MFLTDYQGELLVPGLLSHLDTIVEFLHHHQEHVQLRDDDKFGFMVLCFMSKQLGHACSLRLLLGVKDCVLIARAMAEGACQLIWATKDKASRGDRWANFSAVEDYRFLENRKRAGGPISTSDEDLIKKGLEEHGQLFYTSKAQKALELGKPLPKNPYFTSWVSGVSIREIFKEADAEDLYQFFYGPASRWGHWGPTAFSDILKDNNDRISFEHVVTVGLTASVFSTAIDCVILTAEILFDHFESPSKSEFDEMARTYYQWRESQINKALSNPPFQGKVPQ